MFFFIFRLIFSIISEIEYFDPAKKKEIEYFVCSFCFQFLPNTNSASKYKTFSLTLS